MYRMFLHVNPSEHTHGVFLGKNFSRWASYYESILSIFFETSFCTNGLIRHKKSNIFESVLLTQKNVSIESRSHPLHIDITYILNIPLEKNIVGRDKCSITISTSRIKSTVVRDKRECKRGRGDLANVRIHTFV